MLINDKVCPDLCFEKLKGQLKIEKKNLRQILDKGVTLYYVQCGRSQINTRK